MKKGIDYVGVAIIPFVHDSQGNYVVGFRTENCRDNRNTWEPTGGGGLKFGETVEDGVRREIKEELGADVVNMERLGVREVFRELDGEKTHWIMFDYKVEVDPQQVKIVEPDKCAELRWVKPDAIPEPMMDGFPQFLEAYKEKL